MPDELGITDLLDSRCGGYFEEWNDSPGRTQSEVTAALRTAALDTSKGE